jgi:SAM-dependent methyltransferase
VIRLEHLYTRPYYLADCDGHREFARTYGRKLPKRLAKCLACLAPRPGERILDVGCGRGEVALHAAGAGATSIAVDPSRAALALAGEAGAEWPEVARGISRILARGDRLPIRDASIDAILLADVVEHLEAADLAGLLAECRRVLRPGGRLIVHTQPNRTLVRFTVPFLSRLAWLWGVRLPADLRSEMTPGSGPDFHPSEQSFSSLGRALRRAGFDVQELWLEGSYPVHRIFGDGLLKRCVLRIFRRSQILKALLASQVFARAIRDDRGEAR